MNKDNFMRTPKHHYIIASMLLFINCTGFFAFGEEFSELSWESISTSHFYIYYYAPHAELAEFTAQASEEVFAGFSAKLGLKKWTEKNSIFIYPSTSYLLSNTIYKQRGIYTGSPGEVGIFKHRILIAAGDSLNIYRNNLSRLVLRAMIYRRLMGTGGGIMRLAKSAVYAEWLIFGIGEYFTQKNDPFRDSHFYALRRAERLFLLTELYNFDYLSLTRQRAAVAQSAAMVRWIHEKWGENTVWELIKRYPYYWSNDRLLKAVLGMTQREFIAAFYQQAVVPEPGPDFSARVMKEASGSSRFPVDSLFPAVHYSSGRLFFTGERDGADNVLYIDMKGKERKVFREIPFRSIQEVLSRLSITRNRGTIQCMRFRSPVYAEIVLSNEGMIVGVSYRKSSHLKAVSVMNGIRILSQTEAPDEGGYALCEDKEGQFIGLMENNEVKELYRCNGKVYGTAYSPDTERFYFAACPGKEERIAILSVSDKEDDVRIEMDSPYSAVFPAVSKERLYFCALDGIKYDIYSIPFSELQAKQVDVIQDATTEELHIGRSIEVTISKEVNPVTSDMVIPGILWNGSDEFGIKEYWISLGFSTGVVTTSGFEDDTAGAFLAPKVTMSYIHKFEQFNVIAAAEYQFGDVLDVQDYETRNLLRLDVLCERWISTRVNISAGLRNESMERRNVSQTDYERSRDSGPILSIAFNGIIHRDFLPRRGVGFQLTAARFLESWGSTAGYSRIEMDSDVFFPLSEDSVFQVYGGIFSSIGEQAPEFDMGRVRGVLSQPFFLHAGRYMAVGRAAYRFPLLRNLNYTLSGIVLLRQIRMGIFADAGIVSNTSFKEWKQGADFLTMRKSVGVFFLFDFYPVEGFSIPVVLSYAHDPVYDTDQVKLEFNIYF